MKVNLNLRESGTLCHALLHYMKACDPQLNKQPQWILDLYEKIAECNDKLMRKSK